MYQNSEMLRDTSFFVPTQRDREMVLGKLREDIQANGSGVSCDCVCIVCESVCVCDCDCDG